MPFCKKCGAYYPKSMDACPSCCTEELLLAHRDDLNPSPDMPESERQALKKHRWLGILVGIPLLIALIYAIIYFISKINH